MSKTQVPTVDQFNHAQEVVDKYNQRQEELAFVKKELAFKLSKFSDVKFRINKKDKDVTFAGLYNDNKVKLGIAKCSYGDKFNQDIGKLIAVKKALGESIDDIEKLVEKESFNLGQCIDGGVISDAFIHTVGSFDLRI